MRRIKTEIFALEQRIISEEHRKAKLEQQLNLTKMREYKIASSGGKNGGTV